MAIDCLIILPFGPGSSLLDLPFDSHIDWCPAGEEFSPCQSFENDRFVKPTRRFPGEAKKTKQSKTVLYLNSDYMNRLIQNTLTDQNQVSFHRTATPTHRPQRNADNSKSAWETQECRNKLRKPSSEQQSLESKLA